MPLKAKDHFLGILPLLNRPLLADMRKTTMKKEKEEREGRGGEKGREGRGEEKREGGEGGDIEKEKIKGRGIEYKRFRSAGERGERGEREGEKKKR